jgi:hypothetical protein
MRRLILLFWLCVLPLPAPAGVITYFRDHATYRQMEARGVVWHRPAKSIRVPHGWLVQPLTHDRAVVHDGAGSFRLTDHRDVIHIPDKDRARVDGWLKRRSK